MKKQPSIFQKGLFLILFLVLVKVSFAQTSYPKPSPGDFVVEDFSFESGEHLKNLSLHYVTMGKPNKGADGKIENAVLVLHGTTGSSDNFMNERFSGTLFGPGKILDARKYFIIFTDAIGHGKSSRPSLGLHMRFPKYTYNDMVKAQYELLTEGLGVNHLRLIIGTSMGAMHTWVWGYTYPDFSDALMPLASLPVEIAGRNRILRKMAIDLIEMDPEWKNGDYTHQPKIGLTGAISSFVFMTSSSLQMQKAAPTRIQAEEYLNKMEDRYRSILDANDMIFALDASRFYNPEPHLEKITAHIFAVNSADDEVNPPELGIMEKEIKRVKKGKYILLPISSETAGHGTHSIPSIWLPHLRELLDLSEKKN